MPTKVARALLVLAVGTTGGLLPNTGRAADPATPVSTPTASSLSDLQRLALQWQQEDAARHQKTGFFASLNSAWSGFGLTGGDDFYSLGVRSADDTAPSWFPSAAVTTTAALATDDSSAPLAADSLPADYAPTGATSSPSDAATNFLTTSAPAAAGWTLTPSLYTEHAAPVAAASNAAAASPATVSSSLDLPSTNAVRPAERNTRSLRLGAFTPQAVLPAAPAAISGTLTATATTYNYSTAPWVITSGTGTYPDSGGVATLGPVTSPTPGTIIAGSTVTIDVSPDLSGITYNSPYSYTLAAGTGTSIVADPTNGLTLNAANTATNSPTNFFTTFNTISSPISGGGTTGLIKTGPGIVTLTGANTYTGGTTVNGGFLVVAGTAANGDKVLGTTGTGNDITLNGGTLFTNVTGGLTTARNITLGANGGTIEPSTAFTTSGVVSGTGSFSINGFGAVAVTLTNTNTYTGATITSLSTASALTLNGNGSIATSSSYDLSGTLTLDNSGTTGINRISDTAPITTRGALITTTGNAATASAETLGAITLADGVSVVNVVPGTAGSSLTTASITRQNGSTLFVRGTFLGAAPGAGNGNLFSTTAPTTVGGGGATATSASIVPWALGNLTANVTSSTTTDIGSTGVTYSAATGFRPLAVSEYAALGVNPLDNVIVTAATAATAGSAANSLLFAPTATGVVLSGGPITVTSGSVIYSPTATGTIAGTISAGLNFGTAEGVVQYTNTLALSGTITGTGGLTLSSPTASSVTISGANTYTGTTTVIAGQTLFTGAVANDGTTTGPLGLSTTSVVENAGLGYALLAATANTTFARNLLIAGPASPGLDYFGGASGLTMNGNIDMEHSLTIYAGATTATGVVINGNISGPGTLQGFGASTNVTLNGNNTFTGGVNSQGEVYTLGSDTAFGTGTVFTSAAGTFQGSGTAARTIANNFVTLANPTFAGAAPLTLSGNFNLDGSRSLVISNTAGTTFTGVLSNGAVTKTSAGAVFFNSTTGNTFTGGLTNTGAAATASAIYGNNTSGSAFGTGAVNIGAASATTFSTLAGSFTTSGNASIAGRLSPGNTPAALTAGTAGVGTVGTVNFGGSLIFSSATTSSLYLDVASTASFDKVNVTGALTLVGTVNLASAGTFAVGDRVDLVDWGTLSAGTVTFNETAVTATTASGQAIDFNTSNFLVDGSVTVELAPVPEPATVLGGLLTVGLLGWGLRRRLWKLAA